MPTFPLLVKSLDGSIRGLTVLTSYGEAGVVVINLMVEIQPARFREVMLAPEIDSPGVENLQCMDTMNQGSSRIITVSVTFNTSSAGSPALWACSSRASASSAW